MSTDWSGEAQDTTVTESLRVAAAASQHAALAALMPQVRIIHGEPDEEELVAVVASLMASQAAASAAQADDDAPHAAPRRGGWCDHARRLGVRRPGPGAWGASAAGPPRG